MGRIAGLIGGWGQGGHHEARPYQGLDGSLQEEVGCFADQQELQRRV